MTFKMPQLKSPFSTTNKIHTAARVLMSILFLVSGIGKLGAVKQTQAYMEAYGVPGYLLYPAAALEIGGGTMLLADHNASHTRWLAMVLSGWCILTALIFHTDLNDQEQKINLMKNMAMAGGFLVLAEEGKDRRAELGHVGDLHGQGRRIGEKEKCRPRWATWSEALAAGPEGFPNTTTERFDV
jgi:putative oxidoreductase